MLVNRFVNTFIQSPFYRPSAAWAKRLGLLFSLSLCIVLLLPTVALAHPLGNFTVNRYSRLEVANDQVRLVYIVDMAEIPAHQERTQIDQNGDNTLDEGEQQTYIDHLLATLPQQLPLRLNGQEQAWQLETYELTFPEGQAGLPTLRFATRWTTPLTMQTATWQADYRDESYADRLGWQEIVVQGTNSAKVEDSSVAAADVSEELRVYPDNLLQSPLAIQAATFRFTPLAVGNNAQPASVGASSATSPARAGRPADPFAELINVSALSPMAILLALLAAFGWGAAHAFSPGHGKTIVGAYLVGSRGTIPHALFLGLTTTITHTAGVFALGFVTLFAAQFILPEKLFPWLSMASGVLVVTIGAVMIKERLQGFLGGRASHSHEHDHNHDDPTHLHNHEHSHGQHTHSHVPPGGDGAPVTWRGLLALGISGGLLPCPSALVLMLAAISLQRVGFGLALIVMFSIGLASVLTGIGIVLVYARKLFQHIPEGGTLFRFVPIASALFITVVGVGITLQALMSIGMFTFS